MLNKCETFHRQLPVSDNQRRTAVVIALTVVMMIAEIVSGIMFGSIALLSDGIHMGTHALALLITLIAYIIARRHSQNAKFAFGTGKVGVLGGYSSAIILIIAACLMASEAVRRLISPESIRFNQSILVAVIGLIVNVVSAFLLQDSHCHSHEHDSDDHDHRHHEDHNLKAAYLHVIADALTSVLAIAALLAGKYTGAIWLDPVMGLVGAVVVIKWGAGLLKNTGAILLDYDNDTDLVCEVNAVVESRSGIKLDDIHVWRVSSGDRVLLCSISGVADLSQREQIRERLRQIKHINHATVEFV